MRFHSLFARRRAPRAPTHTRLRRAAHAALALLLAASGSARADGWLGWTRAAPGDTLALNVPADALILGGGFLLWGGSQALRGAVGPQACNLCDGVDNLGLPGEPGDGRGSLNGVDAFFHDALTGWLVSRKTADTTSNILAYGLVPVGAVAAAFFATGPRASDWAGARAGVIVLESLAVGGLAGQVLKFGLARKRPFIRYGHGTDGSTSAEGSAFDVNDPDSHFSFVSGHAEATAAVTISAAMCATMQDSPAAPYLWAGAGTLTVVTGTLRMIAEKHYFTDVLGGVAIGAAAGVLIPWLHRSGGLLGTDGDGSLQLSFAGGSKLGVTWSRPI